MGKVYARRAAYRMTLVSKLVLLTTIVPVMMLLTASLTMPAIGQTDAITAASKTADILADKDLRWAALFVAALNTILTGLMVKVLVSMFLKFLNASVEQAIAMTKVAESFNDLRKIIEDRFRFDERAR